MIPASLTPVAVVSILILARSATAEPGPATTGDSAELPIPAAGLDAESHRDGVAEPLLGKRRVFFSDAERRARRRERLVESEAEVEGEVMPVTALASDGLDDGRVDTASSIEAAGAEQILAVGQHGLRFDGWLAGERGAQVFLSGAACLLHPEPFLSPDPSLPDCLDLLAARLASAPAGLTVELDSAGGRLLIQRGALVHAILPGEALVLP